MIRLIGSGIESTGTLPVLMNTHIANQSYEWIVDPSHRRKHELTLHELLLSNVFKILKY